MFFSFFPFFFCLHFLSVSWDFNPEVIVKDYKLIEIDYVSLTYAKWKMF